jgi:sugar/nucleoside kinase (ribokinase family)
VIVAIGDLMVDVFILPDLQAAEQGSGLVLRAGGSAANTAAWAVRAGGTAGLVACVGDDPAGHLLAVEVEKAGVLARPRIVPGADTGVVLVELSDAGERVMRSSRGANQALSPHDVLAAADLAPDVVHLSGYALLGPYGLDLLAAAAEMARSAGAWLSFDPSSVGVIERFGPGRLLNDMARANVDLLLPNEEEAVALSGAGDAESAACVLATSARRVAVKAGKSGAIWAKGTRSGALTSEETSVKDATGAGDAFNAGILVALQNGADLSAACRLANALGRQAVATIGGSPSAAV